MRGDGIYEKEQSQLDQVVFGIQNKGVYTSQQELCKATGLRTYRDSQRLFGHEKNVCVLTNNQSHVGSLEQTLRKGTQMKIEKAFLHHYKKFGVDFDQIDEAFMKCEETLEAYK